MRFGYIWVQSSICLNDDEINYDENFINVYPNPTHGILYLAPLPIVEEIKVTDVYGKIIFFKKSEAVSSIDLTNFSKGVYILSVLNHGTYKKFKIIKD